MRYSGQVKPVVPATAPLSYRLSNEVYALDGLGCTDCQGKCQSGMGADYIMDPGARLELSPSGKPYETLGGVDFSIDTKSLAILGAVAIGLWYFVKKS